MIKYFYTINSNYKFYVPVFRLVHSCMHGRKHIPIVFYRNISASKVALEGNKYKTSYLREIPFCLWNPVPMIDKMWHPPSCISLLSGCVFIDRATASQTFCVVDPRTNSVLYFIHFVNKICIKMFMVNKSAQAFFREFNWYFCD